MYPERPANAKKAADELVKSGAWEWDDERRAYIISAWLKRNKSAEQVQREREAAEEAALLGNHRRWHEMRGGMDPRCRYCIGGESGTRSGGRSGGGQQDDSTETETETETEKEKPSSPPATDSPEFIRFWSAYPRRVGKGHARRAWNQATKKKGADPESIIAAAEAFAAQCKSNRTEQQYIPHPATWLNGERYADPEPTRTDEPRGWWDN